MPEALRMAAVGVALGILATWRARLIQREAADLIPSPHWSTPVVDGDPKPDRGPVLVTLAYRVHPDRVGAFLNLMTQQGAARR